jgi:5'-nucleotidase
MKIKSHKLSPHLLSTNHIKELGFRWEDLFNPSNAIHTNRELNMSDIKLIGFDMDYTLAIYKKQPMESLQYTQAKAFLVDHLNYPENLKKYSFDQNSIIRGLVVDKHLGNILKLDDQNYVWRASHSRKELNSEQINNFYGSKRIKIGDERYYSLDTFFSIPEACLFIDTLSCLYEQERSLAPLQRFFPENSRLLNFNLVFNEIRLAMDTIHSNGVLKNEIMRDLHRYIEQNNEIYIALKKLNSDGKKLFLLTNSSFGYTHTVLNHVFGHEGMTKQEWLSLFEIIIVDAKKPQFFTGNTPFSCPISDAEDHIRKKIMSAGNIHDFHHLCGVSGQQVLYVGDHIYGDILRSKKDSLWRTCLIIKELSFDIKTSLNNHESFQELKQIHQEQNILDKRLMRLRTLLGLLQNRVSQDQSQSLIVVNEIKTQIKSLTNRLLRLKQRYAAANRKLEDKFHHSWGRLFRESQELSRFGAQVRQYACIYTDHVRNFLRYGANHTFFAHKEPMSHEVDLE